MKKENIFRILVLQLSLFILTGFININDNTIVDSIPRVWTRPNGRRLNNYHRFTRFHYEDGWRTLERFEVPEGYVKIQGTQSFSVDEDGKYIEHWEIQTIEEHELQEFLAHQDAKSFTLKRAENEFLTAVNYINQKFELDLSPDDGFRDVLMKLSSAEDFDKLERIEAGLTLRTLWDIVLFNDGTWKDLYYHDLSLYFEEEEIEVEEVEDEIEVE